MPRQETKAELRERIIYWQKKYEESRSEMLANANELNKDLGNLRVELNRADYKLQEVRKLWNEWLEADKGDESESRLAFVRWEPNTFRRLLTLLRPYEE